MRIAVLVAPDDAHSEGTAWLRDALGRLGFQVANVHPGADRDERVQQALDFVEAGDTLLVHESGELVDEARLRALGDAVAARAPDQVLFVMELDHDGDPDDALAAAERVESIERALDVRARKWGALVAVHPRAEGRDRLAFTRVVVRAAEDAESRDERGAALLSTVYARVRSSPEGPTAAQSYALVRGERDFELAPAPGMAAILADAAKRSQPPSASRVERAPSVHDDEEDEETPELAHLLALATGAREREQWEQALAGYRAALLVVPGDDGEMLAEIYTRIGGVQRARGKRRAAMRAYEKALGVEPGDRAASEALVAMAEEGADFARAVELRRQRLARLEKPAERADALFAIAKVEAERLHDVRAAVASLEEAEAADPAREDVLEALRRAYTVLLRWPKVLEITGALADRAEDAQARAALRFEQAGIARERLRDEERTLAFLEAALEDDPTHEEALAQLTAARTARGELALLDDALARLVDRFARARDVRRAWEACRRLGALRRQAGDAAGAIEAFTGALRLHPDDIEARVALAELFAGEGDDDGAVVELEHVLADAPLEAHVHARLFALHARDGRADRAYLTAQALEELGAADDDARAVLEQHRTPEGLRARIPLDDGAWGYLRAQGSDEVVEALFQAIGRAAIAASVEERREKKKLLLLDASKKQPPTSTASIVRSFHWAARVLGVACPDLYVVTEDVPGGIGAVPAADPSTALGPAVLRGVSAKELAFLAARHLTYYRPEHHVLLYYPTVDELRALFLATVQLALPIAPGTTAVAALRARLARHVTEDELAEVKDAARRLDARGGRADLVAWTRSVELTAGRAGLLLAGDLRAAMARVRGESRAVAELRAEHKRADLVAFSSSRALADLRAAIAGERTSGVSVGSGSLRPPPASVRPSPLPPPSTGAVVNGD